MNRKAWISCRVGLIEADVLEQLGDYAITQTAEGQRLTHLPTGVAIPTDPDSQRSDLTRALVAVQRVPKFDLRTFRKHIPAIRAALLRAKHCELSS